MKQYQMYAIINGKRVWGKKRLSRERANKDVEKMLEEYRLEVQDIRMVDKHQYEFKCNDYNRFFVKRVAA